MLSGTAIAMAECSASDGGKSKGKQQDVKRTRGRPVVEAFEEEVLIESAAASLSSCNQLYAHDNIYVVVHVVPFMKE